MKKIIYVDDEHINLDLFRINFRRHFDVFTCTSAEEALELIPREDIKVIITDYKMPKINGIQLIEKIKEFKPDSVCMILSGYLETEVVTDKSNVFKYIMKPYRKEEVIKYIDQAFSMTNGS